MSMKTVIAFGYYCGRRGIKINNTDLKYNHTMPSISSLNLNLGVLCRDGRLKEAVDILLNTHNPPVDSNTYLQLLSTCIAENALSQGKKIHSFITHRGFPFARHTIFQNKLINMYLKCGSLVDAREVFEEMTERDCFSWNVMIAAYRRHAYPHEALTLFRQMQQTDVKPNQFTFASILPACAKIGALEQGIYIHQSIVECGFLSDVVVASALVDMYSKCGSIHKARELFDKISQRDAVSWNAMVGGYAQNGILDEALHLFKQMLQPNVVSWNVMIAGYVQNGHVEKAVDTMKQMQSAGIEPNPTTFATILPACAKMGSLEQGIYIHQSIIESGFLSDIVVASALIDMYAKCGNIHKAWKLFETMPQRNVVSWTAIIAGYAQNGILGEALRLFKEMPRRDVAAWTVMITGYAQNGLVEKALETFKQMQLAGVKPNSTTFVSILPACAKVGALKQGIVLHQWIVESGLLSDFVVASALIDMYAKHGSIEKARKLFDKMSQRDAVSWNAMIAGYVQNDLLDEALRLFKDMPRRDVVSWNVMIAGYTQNGLMEMALETFRQMQLAGGKPNSTTFANILSACAKLGALEQGMDIHKNIMESGFSSDVVVASSLVDMYAKCGSIQKARQLFNKMSKRDAVSWNAMIAGYAQNGVLDEALRLFKEMPLPDVISWTVMIAGYAQNGLVEKALETFQQMQFAGIKSNSTTFISILPACAKMGALEQGMDIHQSIIKSGFLSDVVIASALVVMYAKCGSIQKARELFDKMSQRDAISWNAMITGYAMHGFCKDALELFDLMKHSGTYPDHVSLVCVLFACSHGGLVDEGCKYFSGMSDLYGMMPAMDHYVCMVDLLGRAGYLEEALNFIIKMPTKPAMVVWICLLGACRLHKNIGLGAFISTFLFELDPQNAVPYVLLSNIYAEVGRWGDAQKVRTLMKDRGTKKIPGCSWIEVHKMVHVFCVGDRSHPQTQEIYAKLENMSWEMKATGYFPDSSQVLNDVEEEEKEAFLCHHSEKLAIAFGLLNTSPETTITVVKNLRVCADCHTATKFISKIMAREIVVRDANRFHHFNQGQCSCGDYW
ncbi:pentatricopeptide repeat-containing protein At2g22070 isoform X1 [Cryptomeria japonica]|uniref:pentatricopeptide repeat-containing protein At2g22070 isoform X1 n=1 Tax=Cryptomeria japonica TaxID=3369 RepID=UPI0027DA706D|nr:pentatricopeptide repeat-containing protein At2g22070 isoform X1 [Cryptomeria japonica]XP_057847769.2 pentatricopeptide repeat-containing protein At2g22070 isoform X1 [Cryptomeria japonica]XP_057847770.2 pentatricopeptide repeat-containing protein At2g22070 isoform X1 [Cryptomeria japonica]XP_057847771.2 pentatricopeptide repeat-containing protein At2g22070 isoform X1 [Cryptomeria japonica]